MTKARKEETIGCSCLPIKIKKIKECGHIAGCIFLGDIIFYKTPIVY